MDLQARTRKLPRRRRDVSTSALRLDVGPLRPLAWGEDLHGPVPVGEVGAASNGPVEASATGP